MTPNYFRTFATPGNPETGARATTVHLGPQTSGDINRDILQSIRCKYKVGKKWKRTDVRVSMFVLTRRGVAADLWRLAMQQGCNVEIVYTQMSQRLKGPNGNWLENEDGEPMGYGSADCLSTPPTKVIVTKASKGKPAKRKVVRNSVGDCSHGSLHGRVPVTSTGVWLNRKSPYGGGRLTVRMACPVQPKYDTVKKTWAVLCIRNDIFTHQKALLVKGFVRGSVQKYVMTGSANWSSPGLRASDEVITEIRNAGALYDQYKANGEYLKKVVKRNSAKKSKKQLRPDLHAPALRFSTARCARHDRRADEGPGLSSAASRELHAAVALPSSPQATCRTAHSGEGGAKKRISAAVMALATWSRPAGSPSRAPSSGFVR